MKKFVVQLHFNGTIEREFESEDAPSAGLLMADMYENMEAEEIVENIGDTKIEVISSTDTDTPKSSMPRLPFYPYQVYDINWDVDEDEDEENDLPTKYTIYIPAEIVEKGEEAINSFAVEYLSNNFGFTIIGFSCCVSLM